MRVTLGRALRGDYVGVKPEPRRGLDLEPGTVLGKYEILRKLATGGMAEIYLCRSRGTAGFEKLVVLKRILPHIAQDPAFVNMFLDEARLAATLQHPNIADVYDVGEYDQGEVFFTMEYVHGQDVRGIRWAARKRDEQIPLAIALAIVHGTASALDYAHEKRGPDGQLLGLVHRDISSSNIMISYDGAVKLLDFGIARATNQTHKTQTGTLKGKIPYMSPEQCRSAPLDRRSDLFSLGTVMFEVTTGRRPFRGSGDFEIMEQIVHVGAPRPSQLVKGYPEELEAIVMKLLAREREERYQTAEEMLHDLDAFLAKHQLWASTKVVGKYMRGAFAERIAAWEAARSEGEFNLPESLTPLTSGSDGRRELLTPSASFPAVRLSQERLAIQRPSDEAIDRDGETVAMPVGRGNQAALDTAPVQLVNNRRLYAIAGGGLALGALAIVIVMLMTRGDAAPAAQVDEVVKEPVKATAPTAVEKPAPPPVEKPPGKPTPIEKPVDKPPAVEVTETPKPGKPVARSTVKPVVIAKPVAKPPAKDPKKDDKPPPKPETESWDPNSPFLPPKTD